jgi:hypothetical protein
MEIVRKRNVSKECKIKECKIKERKGNKDYFVGVLVISISLLNTSNVLPFKSTPER